MIAESEFGEIATECCYSEESKFITNKGKLILKNIHKSSEINLLNGGSLIATGFHGKLHVKAFNSSLDLQLTEIYDESLIEATDPKQFNVNISEFIEEHTCVLVEANAIELHPTLSHLNEHLSSKGNFSKGDSDRVPDSLTIKTNGNVQLGKMSWMDTIKIKFPSIK